MSLFPNEYVDSPELAVGYCQEAHLAFARKRKIEDRYALARGGTGQPLPDHDREIAERHTEGVTLTANHIELHLRQCIQAAELPEAAGDASDPPEHPRLKTITIPWTSPVPAAIKGIVHVPAHSTPMTPSRRDKLVLDELAPFAALTMTKRGKQTNYEAKNVRLAKRMHDEPEGHARSSQNERAAPARAVERTKRRVM